MIISSLLGNYSRPDRTIPENQKNQAYDNQWARHTVAYGYLDARHKKDVDRIIMNRNFFMNRQWEKEEDLETFLKDQTGQTRNRITFTLNKISSLVNVYRGNASKLTLEFSLKNMSPDSYTRKEEGLKKLLFFFQQANRVPEFSDTIRNRLPVGDTEQETISNYERSYVDAYVEEMSKAMQAIATRNEFSDRVKPAVAESLAFAGRAHVFDLLEGTHQKFVCVRPEDVWWDRAAVEYDFQDGSFCGFIRMMSPTQIIESCELPLTKQQRTALLNYGSGFISQAPIHGMVKGQYSSTSIPVFNTFWRDTTPIWFGYVQDDQGMVTLQKINWIEEGDQAPKYTDENLVDPPKDSRIAKRFNGKKKIKINCDYVRYCTFVPWEYVSFGNGANATASGMKSLDIVFSHGPLPYQDHRFQDFSTCRLPMKSWCWFYSNGEVTAPMDDAINPQRFLNRILSVAENQMNNSGGTGTVFDRDTLEDEDELQVMSDMNQGKPVFINAKRQGVQNMTYTYDNTPKAGSYKLFDMVGVMSQIVDQSVGINDAMRGESMGQDQLVGVFDRMMEQGSIIQAPFYNAVASIFKQCYQAMADRGKRIYIDNPPSLMDISGDYGSKVITLSAGMRNEDMRVEVQQEQSSRLARQTTDATVFQFLQLGLIDRNRFANLYGRATMSQVLQGMRDYAAELTMLSREQKKQAEAERQAFLQMAQEQQQYERSLPVQEHMLQVDRDNNKHKNTMERDRSKAVIKNITTQLSV